MTDTRFAELQHLTPVLLVDRVEPCIEFWVERFGFTREHTMPGPDGSLIFASLRRDAVEIMYQTRASVEADLLDARAQPPGLSAILFFTVPDLAAVERAVEGASIVKGRHQTSYGSTELYVRDPGGHIAGFAQF